MNTFIFCTVRIASLLIIVGFFSPVFAQQEVHLNAQSLQPNVDVYFSPRSGSFTQDSTFEVPIVIDTNGASVNSMELEVVFDPTKLSVVNPSGGRSIIGVWIEPPSYDNTRGVVRFVGTIPGGITADSGLIATITFRARASGDTALRFSGSSQVLLNDGYGSTANATFGRASYTITAKPPEGVAIYSDTHPSPDRWYNNTSPVLSWNAPDADAVSFVLDTSPLTVPDNTAQENTGVKAFEGLTDGQWYFHLKTRRNGAWGNTTHFPIKIDTTPPAEFKPHIDYIAAAAAAYHGLVTFETTDALSGIDHYEVGTIDLATPNASPVFIQTESPYRVPSTATKTRVIVRAFDTAGNIRDASIDVDTSSLLALAMRNIWTLALAAALILILALFGIHYLIRHHVLHYLKDAWRIFRKEQKLDAAMSEEAIDLSTIDLEVHDENGKPLPKTPAVDETSTPSKNP